MGCCDFNCKGESSRHNVRFFKGKIINVAAPP